MGGRECLKVGGVALDREQEVGRAARGVCSVYLVDIELLCFFLFWFL